MIIDSHQKRYDFCHIFPICWSSLDLSSPRLDRYPFVVYDPGGKTQEAGSRMQEARGIIRSDQTELLAPARDLETGQAAPPRIVGGSGDRWLVHDGWKVRESGRPGLRDYCGCREVFDNQHRCLDQSASCCAPRTA
jgi:hypothetical protein